MSKAEESAKKFEDSYDFWSVEFLPVTGMQADTYV